MNSRGRYPSQNPAQRVKELENELLNLKLENKQLKQELASYKNTQGQPVVPKLEPKADPEPEVKQEEKPRVNFWGGKKEEDS